MNKKDRRAESMAAAFFDWVYVVVLALLIFSGFYLHGPLFAGRLGTAGFLHSSANYLILALLAIKVYLRLLQFHPAPSSPANKAKRAVLMVSFFLIIPEALVAAGLFSSSGPLGQMLQPLLGGLANIYLVHYFLVWLLFSAFSVYIYFSLVELSHSRTGGSGEAIEPTYRQ